MVSIFRITQIAAANVSVFGNISSCYYPQVWELQQCDLLVSRHTFGNEKVLCSSFKFHHHCRLVGSMVVKGGIDIAVDFKCFHGVYVQLSSSEELR